MTTDETKPIPPHQTPPKPLATIWGQIIHATPIVLTVLATVLAGLSSSEMTQSMYFRTLAGQFQAKVGDQWAYFQAERIRATNLQGTVTLMRSIGHADPLDASRLKSSLAGAIRSLAQLSIGATEAGKSAQSKLDQWFAAARKNQTLRYLTGPDLPDFQDQRLPDTDKFRKLNTAVQAMSRHLAEADLADIVRPVDAERIDEASRLAQLNGDASQRVCKPVAESVVQLRSIVAELAVAASPFLQSADAAPSPPDSRSAAIASLHADLDQLSSGIEIASMDFDARCFLRQSVYSKDVAELYEVRVARSDIQADLHRQRSRMFFFSMLLAQAGVTIASLALARAGHSLFWMLAVLAGLCSLVFTSVTYISFG